MARSRVMHIANFQICWIFSVTVKIDEIFGFWKQGFFHDDVRE